MDFFLLEVVDRLRQKPPRLNAATRGVLGGSTPWKSLNQKDGRKRLISVLLFVLFQNITIYANRKKTDFYKHASQACITDRKILCNKMRVDWGFFQRKRQ
jgi:hypothetical protein